MQVEMRNGYGHPIPNRARCNPYTTCNQREEGADLKNGDGGGKDNGFLDAEDRKAGKTQNETDNKHGGWKREKGLNITDAAHRNRSRRHNAGRGDEEADQNAKRT